MVSQFKNTVNKIKPNTLKFFKYFILVGLTFFFIFFLVKSASNCSIGFISGYTASTNLINGANASDFYKGEYFALLVQKICPETIDIYSPNPPTYSLMMMPFAGTSFHTAKALWVILSVIFVFFSYLLIKKEYLEKHEHINLVLPLLIFQPLYANFKMGQNYGFLLLMLVLIWYGWKNDKYLIAGIALALMTCLKVGIIWLWPLLVISRQWKIIGIAGITSCTILISSYPLLGSSSWIAFFDDLYVVSKLPAGSVTAYQSIPSIFRHLFTYDPKWNPYPLIELSFLGNVIPQILALGVIFTSLALSLMSKNIHLKISMITIVSVIISPLSLDYHYPFLLLPMAILYPYVLQPKEKSLLIWFLLAFTLIALPIPYTYERLANGILAIFAYPKLYGGIILLGLVLKLMIQEIKLGYFGNQNNQ
jgi:hypothetical protein